MQREPGPAGDLPLRLRLPAPIADRLDAIDIAPGVTLRVHRAEPLPLELEHWHVRTIGRARMVTTERLHTETGWAVTVIRVAEPAALFAFFELFDRGVVVTAIARDDEALDAAIERLRSLLCAADIDRTQREIVAIAQIWTDS